MKELYRMPLWKNCIESQAWVTPTTVEKVAWISRLQVDIKVLGDERRYLKLTSKQFGFKTRGSLETNVPFTSLWRRSVRGSIGRVPLPSFLSSCMLALAYGPGRAHSARSWFIPVLRIETICWKNLRVWTQRFKRSNSSNIVLRHSVEPLSIELMRHQPKLSHFLIENPMQTQVLFANSSLVILRVVARSLVDNPAVVHKIGDVVRTIIDPHGDRLVTVGMTR